MMGIDWDRQVSIAPLVVFRILFGLIMCVSMVRFIARGWVNDNFIEPSFHFKYYGFEWIEPLGALGMYALFGVLVLATIMIAIGFYYRLAIVTFFLVFTYVELIDITYYLNHYYFISLVSFLMIFLPADRYFSVKVWRNSLLEINTISSWYINAIKLMLAILYIHAGLAKLNPDWLLEALPLSLWLPSHSHLPVIGSLLAFQETAYLMSWAGCLFDLFVVFFLIRDGLRVWAYSILVVFHLATGLLFQIGMFPYVMILLTLIFFSEEFHNRLIRFISGLLPYGDRLSHKFNKAVEFRISKSLKYALLLFFVVQLILPWRFLLYPGKLFWTEQGYSFSWRVMLMEKSGYALFKVSDKGFDGSIEVDNNEFLTPIQEKMMSTQPDLILQYAHFLKKQFKGYVVMDSLVIKEPVIKADIFVSLNGQKMRRMVDDDLDLASLKPSLCHKKWVLPFE